MNQNELYQQVILSHNKSPKNFGKPATFTHWAEGFNPLCGDHYFIYLTIEDDVIKNVFFEGEGCAISKASASLMTESLKNKTISDVESIIKKFHDYMTLSQGNLKDLGKISVLSGVKDYPARIKCATISWHTMKQAIETPVSE
jgi:nitrogen fixation NifU-like protein